MYCGSQQRCCAHLSSDTTVIVLEETILSCKQLRNSLPFSPSRVPWSFSVQSSKRFTGIIYSYCFVQQLGMDQLCPKQRHSEGACGRSSQTKPILKLASTLFTGTRFFGTPIWKLEPLFIHGSSLPIIVTWKVWQSIGKWSNACLKWWEPSRESSKYYHATLWNVYIIYSGVIKYEMPWINLPSDTNYPPNGINCTALIQWSSIRPLHLSK